jgi:hypothetical protein
MNKEEFADEINSAIGITVEAHTRFAKSENDKIKFWDHATPYIIHPIWCAMTLLTETTLPENIRNTGYKVLHGHDILEDTALKLPEGLDVSVRALINKMTFESFDDEKKRVWEHSLIAILLKLYDKVSNLLDGT